MAGQAAIGRDHQGIEVPIGIDNAQPVGGDLACHVQIAPIVELAEAVESIRTAPEIDDRQEPVIRYREVYYLDAPLDDWIRQVCDLLVRVTAW